MNQIISVSITLNMNLHLSKSNSKALSKYLIIFIMLTSASAVYSQIDSVIFDNNFKFKDGIYTSFEEVINNDPKIPNLILEKEIHPLCKKNILFYYDDLNNRQKYTDSVFAFAQNNVLYIKHRKEYSQLKIKGAISVFFKSQIIVDVKRGTNISEDTYILDLSTGKIAAVFSDLFEEIIKRDSVLYQDFITDSPESSLNFNKIKAYNMSFLFKYNAQNPVYIYRKD